MRAVKGFDKPIVQWMIVAASVLLVALLTAATLSLRARAGRMAELVDSQRTCLADREALDAQLARERAAREAFSLELGRIRAQQAGTETGDQGTPSLTLAPPARRGPVPPEAAVAAPGRAESIELRLILPANVAVNDGGVQIAARDWADGRALWATGRATVGAVDGRRALIAHVTGEMLAPGSYELIVTPSAAADTAPEAIAVYEVTIAGVTS